MDRRSMFRRESRAQPVRHIGNPRWRRWLNRAVASAQHLQRTPGCPRESSVGLRCGAHSPPHNGGIRFGLLPCCACPQTHPMSVAPIDASPGLYQRQHPRTVLFHHLLVFEISRGQNDRLRAFVDTVSVVGGFCDHGTDPARVTVFANQLHRCCAEINLHAARPGGFGQSVYHKLLAAACRLYVIPQP